MVIKKLSDIYDALKTDSEKKRMVVAFANDRHSIQAAYMAVSMGLVSATLVGDAGLIRNICNEQGYDYNVFTVVSEEDEVKAVERSVAMVHEGKADILMKGLVSTDKYMHVILNKNSGLVPPDTLLSHVTIFECAAYHKLLIVGDVAVVPIPDWKQKVSIIRNVVSVAGKLGMERPKVAVLSASELVLPAVLSSVDAAILSKMGERGQFGNVAVEGPLALDVAISKEAAEIKNIHSEVVGDADCLIFPNLETGNVFYKVNTKLGSAKLGAVLVGAKVPCVLSSRGDSTDDKLNSIALAAMMAR